MVDFLRYCDQILIPDLVTIWSLSSQGRQTVLFSATLPKILVDFAKAGLSEPTLIRLDVDNKIPETLKMGFLHCREEGKTAVLLHLFRHVINQDQNKPEQTVVFCATRHHVEYLHLLLDSAGISNSYIYSQLDATARKINAAKFQTKKVIINLGRLISLVLTRLLYLFR